jgi:hypothetical protein
MRSDLHLVPSESGGAGAHPSLLRNGILAKLPVDELELVASQGETYTATLREVFFDEGEPLDFVFFPLTAMASLVTVLADGGMVEAMAVGREGFVGLTVVHEANV